MDWNGVRTIISFNYPFMLESPLQLFSQSGHPLPTSEQFQGQATYYLLRESLFHVQIALAVSVSLFYTEIRAPAISKIWS